MATTQTPPDIEPPPAREGWWGRQTTTARILLIAVPVLLALVTVVVLLPRSSQPAASPQPSAPNTTQRANACLGGAPDLNSAVQYAQANAPLTGTGAAEFLATVLRWMATPAVSQQPGRAAIAERLAPAATDEAIAAIAAGFGDSFTSAEPTFEGGYYRVESVGDGTATVTVHGWVETVGASGTPVQRHLFGTSKLVVVDGVWTWSERLAAPWERLDDAAMKAAEDAAWAEITRTGQPFQGSC